MANFLVVYGTVSGHTRRVAERVAEHVGAAAHQPDVRNATGFRSPETGARTCDAVIACAAVHSGRHPESLVSFLKDHRGWLADIPSALISISLLAAFPEPLYQIVARSYVDELLHETGWNPSAILLLGGALQNGHDDVHESVVGRLLVERLRDTDASSGGGVHTDWGALESFVRRFVDRAAPGIATGDDVGRIPTRPGENPHCETPR